MIFKNKIILLFCSLALLSSCSSIVRFSSSEFSTYSSNNLNLEKIDFDSERGFASYYGDEFEGRKTASGEIFSQEDFTAAHKSLPFGVKVLVKNLENGKTCVVKINDRGPFVSGRIIDLSKAAAKELGMMKKGIIEVEIKLLK